ncbi:Crossover junction endonuclease mus81-like protein [Oopsacas minuta]|uniref:Crossover junction endonuclease mus81-like protein n=1 Tax=Oopsacas minuta TaxID=111878 RepID=A0AAV7JUB8_9METZ|nr:Crossover junction endonuclease mus81-like protein [Oopsacas minuta]
MEDSDGLTIVGTEQKNALKINLDISNIVNKVRPFAKLFKRSALQNEICRLCGRKQSNGLQLILVSETRWISLLNMLESIVEIQISFQKALLDLNSDIQISDE